MSSFSSDSNPGCFGNAAFPIQHVLEFQLDLEIFPNNLDNFPNWCVWRCAITLFFDIPFFWKILYAHIEPQNIEGMMGSACHGNDLTCSGRKPPGQHLADYICKAGPGHMLPHEMWLLPNFSKCPPVDCSLGFLSWLIGFVFRSRWTEFPNVSSDPFVPEYSTAINWGSLWFNFCVCNNASVVQWLNTCKSYKNQQWKTFRRPGPFLF